MSQFYEYNWPAPIANGISLFQKLTKNTPLLLNGSYVNKTTRIVNFVDDFGIVPRVTLSSATNLSGINFLITGYQNGVFISETLAGPNNTTVKSVNCFDTVTQIIPNNTADSNVQVGVASVGYFPIILLNTAKSNVSGIRYSLNLIPEEDDVISCHIFISLKNKIGMGKYDDLIKNGDFFPPTPESITVSSLIESDIVAKNLLIQIESLADLSIKAQFLQL